MLAFRQGGNDVEIVRHTPNHEQVALSRKTNMVPVSPEIADLGSSVGTRILICNSQLIFRGLKCLHIKAQTALSLLGDVTSFQRDIVWKMWRRCEAHGPWDQGIQENLFYLSQAKESRSRALTAVSEGRILHTLLLLKSSSAFESLIEAPLSD